MKNKFLITIIGIMMLTAGQAQNTSLEGSWSGWYTEGKMSYDIRVDLKEKAENKYEGILYLKKAGSELSLSIEAGLNRDNTFYFNELEILKQTSPSRNQEFRWCRAEYNFNYSEFVQSAAIGLDLQTLEGKAHPSMFATLYVDGKKIFNHQYCKDRYTMVGNIELRKDMVIQKAKPVQTQTKQEEIKDEPQQEEVLTQVDEPMDLGTDRDVVAVKLIDASESVANVSVWDDKTVDGDIISIYLNGKSVQPNIGLTKDKETFDLQLQQGKNIVVMHAENLGSIPPNSAAMQVKVGDKEYNMVLSSDTKKSESIVIYYYPNENK